MHFFKLPFNLLLTCFKLVFRTSFQVSASTSTGAAGRGFKASWAFGAGSTPQLAQQLEDKMNGTGLLLEIASADFLAAVEALRAMNETFSSDIRPLCSKMRESRVLLESF